MCCLLFIVMDRIESTSDGTIGRAAYHLELRAVPAAAIAGVTAVLRGRGRQPGARTCRQQAPGDACCCCCEGSRRPSPPLPPADRAGFPAYVQCKQYQRQCNGKAQCRPCMYLACTYRQRHRPLLAVTAARRGAERLDGDRGRIAAGAAQTELEIQLAVPGCMHSTDINNHLSTFQPLKSS